MVPKRVAVSYAYGYSSDIGGGPYNRTDALTDALTQNVTVHIGVTKDLAQVDGQTVFGSLADAIDTWNQHAATSAHLVGVIAIMDSASYEEDLTNRHEISIPEGSQLVIVAAFWPEVEGPDGPERPVGFVVPDNLRPHLHGDIDVRGTAGSNSPDSGELVLQGLVIEGNLRVSAGNLGTLRVAHCTLVPGCGLDAALRPHRPDLPSLIVELPNANLQVEISQSIVGPLRLPETITSLTVRDSIIHAPLRDGPGTRTSTLVSGSLASFPTLSAATLSLNVQIGNEGPHTAILTGRKPTTRAQARYQLQAAIRAAHSSPSFTATRVVTAANRLIIVPGTPETVVVTPAGGDPTSAELRLTDGSERQLLALLSPPLSPFPSLSSRSPALNVTMDDEGPHPIRLRQAPTSVAQARNRLHPAIRTAHNTSAFRNAIVGSIGGQLIVLSGAEDTAVLLGTTANDQTTLLELGLFTDRPALAADDIGTKPGPTTYLERLTLSSTGRDEVLGLAPDHWVELTDDKQELYGESGTLVKVTQIEGSVLTIDPGMHTIDKPDASLNPKVRRWDMPGNVGEITVDVADNWIALEDGIQVKLGPGIFRTGDYWLIPARTATQDIEWPRGNVMAAALPQSPHGIRHRYCRLALLDFDGTAWTRLSDCRMLFPPLTEMVRLFHVSGDGQEAMPDQPLLSPIEVGVANGQWPIADARVRFQVTRGNGQLQAVGPSPCANFTTGGDNFVDVDTGPLGIAACCWRLDGGTPTQRVAATLLEVEGKPMVDDSGNSLITPIRFNANLSVATQVAYDPNKCEELSGVTTVQEAIDALCQVRTGSGCCVTVGPGGEFVQIDTAINELLAQGETRICLCLSAHIHLLTSFQLTRPDVHLEISGCGRGATEVQVDTDLDWELGTLTLKDMRLVVAQDQKLQLSACDLFLDNIHLFSTNDQAVALLELPSSPPRSRGRCRIVDSIIEAYSSDFTSKFGILGSGVVKNLPTFGEVSEIPFREQCVSSLPPVMDALAALDKTTREGLSESIQNLRDDWQATPSERIRFSAFTSLLEEATPDPGLLGSLYIRVRDAMSAARPANACVIFPGGTVEMRNNDISGTVSLYGLPSPQAVPRQELLLTEATLKTLSKNLVEQSLNTPIFDLISTGQELRVQNNRITRITVDEQLIDQIQQAGTGQTTPLLGLFERAFFSDNVFEDFDNHFIFRHINMSSCRFDYLPEDDTDPILLAGLVLGEYTSLVGTASSASSYTHLWVLNTYHNQRFAEAGTVGLRIDKRSDLIL